ncbi:hypothetical protein [Tabrizicola sp.]|jgi:hypothetical protein|uniref:hypothetical protein n=1 Tax=Tabrizicola sp. TaxID=2005166 RepID=UPI003D2E7AF9
MPVSDMTLPKDIGPASGINLILGLCLLILAAVPALPVVTALHYDGLASVFRWPALFNWLALTTVSLGISGVYMLVTPQRVGGNVWFHETGFALSIRLFFRKDQTPRVNWSDVTTVEVLLVGRGDTVTIRTDQGVVARFSPRFFDVSIPEMMARFRQSAQGAGFDLVQSGGFNLLLVERQVWHVRRAAPTR